MSTTEHTLSSETLSRDGLRTQARNAARSWTVCDKPPVSSLIEKWRKADRSIGRASQALSNASRTASLRERLGDDAQWFLDHRVMLSAALQETKNVAKEAAELVHVQTVDTLDQHLDRVPRAYVAADLFFRTVEYRPDAATFVSFLCRVQEYLPFSSPELWMLRSLALLVLLEHVGKAADALNGGGESGGEVRLDGGGESGGEVRLDGGGESGGEVRLDGGGEMSGFITSIKWLTDLDWEEVFLRVSMTDLRLRGDPLGVYDRMDFESREQYCREAAFLARHSVFTEQEVAEQAIILARAAQTTTSERARERRSHVGYYLQAEGNAELRRAIGYQPAWPQQIRETLLRSPEVLYLGGIGVATFLVLRWVLQSVVDTPGFIGLLLLLLPALACGVGIVNTLATRLVGPRRLPRLDFSEGIPEDCSTMVVVPTLLVNETQMRQVVRDLEIRYLANRDAHLHFALLTDPPDSFQQFDEKDNLAGLCSSLIDELNRRYAGQHGSFFHFHRNRVYSESEETWMAWERKRGKLRDLNVLLQGREDRFPVKTGNLSALSSIKYVITLDVDTQLPRDTARHLVAALAHPLNRAVVDPETNSVAEGYGVLQPRVEMSFQSTSRSRLASICSGDAGFDIYTRAVSNVYQDLFNEGLFAGKGIYEVEVFQQVLEHRFPAGVILSHDLIEGAYARTALISDLEVIDDYPSHLSAFSRRRHRWVRGDWQTIWWLLPIVPDFDGRLVRNPLSLISRWQIVDNLCRSLTDFATFLLFLYGWLFFGGPAWRWTLAALAITAGPALFGFALSLLPIDKGMLSGHWWRAVARELGQVVAQLLFRLAFLCHQGFVATDAAVRATVRLGVTHKKLLEWETAAQAESAEATHPVETYLDWTTLLASGLVLCVAFFQPKSFLAAVPLLLLWSASKPISSWLARPYPSGGRRVGAADSMILRTMALRTWRFFREFSNGEERHLIPDVVQEMPEMVVHQVSPTNLGLLLNAQWAAYDLGYSTLAELVSTTERAIHSIQEMPKHDGHFYNWYDSRTLQPNPPLFLSTVDNGNLVCSLWTLKQGCLEIQGHPLFGKSLAWGIRDHLAAIEDLIVPAQHGDDRELLIDLHRLKSKMGTFARHPWVFLNAMPWLESETARLVSRLFNRGAEFDYWVRELTDRIAGVKATIADFAPWLSPEFEEHCPGPEFRSQLQLRTLTLRTAPSVYAALDALIERIPGNREDAHWQNLRGALARSSGLCRDLAARLDSLASSADELAGGMNFARFFDPKKKLLSIGYHTEEGRRDETHYGLLASEARAALFVAIARGDVPQQSWFSLSRTQTRWNDQGVLLSWSGTMFEYLMPSLWMQSYPNTLLQQTERPMLQVQQEFAARNEIPWGISESSCGRLNADRRYAYAPFGVPELAVNQRMPDGLVVSPYSSFLALAVDAAAAMQNLRQLAELGPLGRYGFYEAFDCTASREQPQAVRCWMAHHQAMILVASANFLCDSPMQRRFHNEPFVVATERLLQEKLPSRHYAAIEEAAAATSLEYANYGRYDSRRSAEME
jgi:cyclic beta-1,2-glucan synthetase